MAFVLRACLEPFVPCLRGAAAQHKQDGQDNLQTHDSCMFHFTVDLSAVTEPRAHRELAIATVQFTSALDPVQACSLTDGWLI